MARRKQTNELPPITRVYCDYCDRSGWVLRKRTEGSPLELELYPQYAQPCPYCNPNPPSLRYD